MADSIKELEVINSQIEIRRRILRQSFDAEAIINKLNSAIYHGEKLKFSQIASADILLAKLHKAEGAFGIAAPDFNWSGGSEEGWTYIARAIGTDRYKIGMSEADDINKRLNSIQTSCPFPIRLVNKIKGACWEKYLHKRLQEYRVIGEWFILPRPVVKLLASAI